MVHLSFLRDLYGDKGLVKFRGHKNAITEVAFVELPDTLPVVVSSSKDRLLKVWDLTAQHCVQTVVGHTSEVWTFALSPTQQRIVSASNEAELRVFKVLSAEELDALKQKEASKPKGDGSTPAPINSFDELEADRRLEFIGTVTRKVNDRPNRIKFTLDGTLFAVQVRPRSLSF